MGIKPLAKSRNPWVKGKFLPSNACFFDDLCFKQQVITWIQALETLHNNIEYFHILYTCKSPPNMTIQLCLSVIAYNPQVQNEANSYSHISIALKKDLEDVSVHNNWGYIASFEIPYDTISKARLKLDTKIKKATKKFPANSEIIDWRPRFNDFLRLHRRWMKKIEMFRQGKGMERIKMLHSIAVQTRTNYENENARTNLSP
ncbi:hypothetical protein LXL04_008889 [Taraxacum kok-saghyz]